MTKALGTAMIAALLPLLASGSDGDLQPDAASWSGQAVVSIKQRVHLEVTSTLRDVLRHPAFAGFARLILPWDDRVYDERLPCTTRRSIRGPL